MKKYLWLALVILAFAALIGSFFIWKFYKNKKNTKDQHIAEVQSNVDLPVAPPATTTTKSAPVLIYPISNFSSRATENLFGSYFAPGGSSNPDRKVCKNATYYSGYHTAIDLETTADETNSSVPVLAIASGIVRQAGSVSGYGGLIVIEYDLSGSKYTAYYGHVDISTVSLKKDQKVNIGDKLGELGAACSSSNGDVRKHLHFGLHKGTAIDVCGYVPNQNELSAWVDPALLLSSLEATQ
jgi:murein DD-endopeptidase MepM/ murein hydrolase activator NlpD